MALRAGIEVPLATRLRDERRIMVRIASKEEAETLKEQSREEIADRIQQAAGETQDNLKVDAIQKLKSGDIAIHVDSSKTKKDLEAETN